VLDLDDFSQAVARIYDASVDVDRWPDALSALARMFGGKGAQISVASAPDAVAFIRISGWSNEELAQFIPAYLALTPTDPRAVMSKAPYRVMHCRQFLSDEALWASEMYKQALRPSGVEYTMAVTVPVDGDMACVLSVMRGADGTVFTTEDCEDFGRLVPHAGRAAHMHAAFRRCREELASVKALLDGVPLGMMVVQDDELKVANRAARVLLGEGDAMQLHNGRLQGSTRRAESDLRDAVHAALDGTDQPIGVNLPVDHAQPVRVMLRKLHPASAGMLGAQNEAVALYVSDPRKPIETPEEVLQRLFGLTGREASVLRILAEGGDLQEAASRLGIGLGTVRTHIKHIKDTTGAHRQAELVRMVWASPAWIAGQTTIQ